MLDARFLLWWFACAAAAQEPAPPSLPDGPRLLVRQQLVPLSTLKPAGNLGLTGNVREATWLGNDVYAIADYTVDTAALEVLNVSADRVRLRTFTGRELWSVDRTAVNVDAAAQPAQRAFCGERLVMPRTGGGLTALDRRTGARAWQREDVPAQLLLADSNLVASAGLSGGKHLLAVCAATNGALAFRVELPGVPQRLVAGAQGIAVVHAGGVTVFDRTGPQLFSVAAPVTDLVASGDGWFAATAGKIESWTHLGKQRWQIDLPLPHFESLLLAATGSGDLVAVTFHPMSDSGCNVLCLARDDGAKLWRRDEPGLGVEHSKYWHRVQARICGDELLLTSQAAGGNFAVALDVATGDRRGREVVK